MMARQAELFDDKPAPRRRGQLMHVSDAGYGGCSDSGRSAVNVTLTCRKCDYQSEWLRFDTVTEAKRGLPCPRCNPPMITADEAKRKFG